MICAGFDQASNVTGYGVIEDGALIDHGLINHESIKKDQPLRVKTMFESITRLIDRYVPDYLTVESTYYRHNLASFKLLSELAGMVLGYGYAKGIPSGQLMPSAWRKIVGIKTGKNVGSDEEKRLAVQFVKEKFGVDCQDDEAEGICIAWASWLLNSKS